MDVVRVRVTFLCVALISTHTLLPLHFLAVLVGVPFFFVYVDYSGVTAVYDRM